MIHKYGDVEGMIRPEQTPENSQHFYGNGNHNKEPALDRSTLNSHQLGLLGTLELNDHVLKLLNPPPRTSQTSPSVLAQTDIQNGTSINRSSSSLSNPHSEAEQQKISTSLPISAKGIRPKQLYCILGFGLALVGFGVVLGIGLFFNFNKPIISSSLGSN